MTGSIGRRYARAVLALAGADGRREETGQELASLAAAFADEQLQAVISNPEVGPSAREELAGRLADVLDASDTVSKTVRLLARRDRLDILGDIATAYRDMLDRALGRTRVLLRSATPLTAENEQQLVELAHSLARQEVLVTTEVDEDLLGGAVLDVGGVVYDGSIKTQLSRMAKAMTGRS